MSHVMHPAAPGWSRRRLLGAAASALGSGLGMAVGAGFGLPLLGGCSEQAAPAHALPVAATEDTPAHRAVLAGLYDKARAAGESQVVVYTAFGGATALWELFSQRFPGIQAVPAQAAAASLFTRLAAERRSGNHAGDLVLSGFSDMAELVRQDFLIAETPDTAAALPARFREPGGRYQLPWQNVFTIAYNSTLTAPAALPGSLADLQDPAWRGRIVLPRLAGTSVPDVVLATLVNSGKLDDKALHALRAQSRQLDMGELVNSVGQGRIPFAVWAPAQSIVNLANSGAPVKLTFPPDVAVLFGPGVGLLDQAPHPHAARLFKAWLFSAHGQGAIARQLNSYGTMPGAPAPAGFPALDSYRQKDLPLADANRLLSEFRQRTLAIWGER